ncbi:hypothetical protein NHH03_25240 [Stieleria sp. TO1_6]|uniref:hypothetical protein n=1 Tax=Stieleria tagensis TaxID=2956795 RepID=UPI00209A833C|nr:hypothetical protein [Stieleria tagensis]MCO8125066.1 hypothetical protein [Stieleria tagensis]
MKQLLWTHCVVGIVVMGLAGCGGHEGGMIDLSENPYQVTESEQQAMNRANRAPDEPTEDGDGTEDSATENANDPAAGDGQDGDQ